MRGSTRLRPKYRWAVAACVTVSALILGPSLYIRCATLGDTVSSDGSARHAEAAIVLGAKVKEGGFASPFLRERVLLGSRLYLDGYVDVVVMTGATGPNGYDETATMRDIALAEGVPESAIILDREGWDTFASCANAAGPLGIESAIVVTQGFHVARATWLCQQAGVSTQGMYPPVWYRKGTFTGNLREIGASWKAVLNVWGGRD